MAKSKAQKARAEGMRATLEMVKKTGKHTYDAIRDSPKKLSRLLTSPARKRLRPSSPHETSPDTDHNLSDTSIGAYENLRPWHIEISIPDASEPTQDQPEDTARTLHSKWTPPRTDKHRNDASPKGCSFFSLSGPPSSPPRGAAVSHTFKWKPATVEDAADDDAGSDVPSVATFPMPEPPELFSTPPTPPMPCSLPEIDRGEYAYGYGHDESDVKSDAVSIPEERAETPPSSACPSPVPSEELDYMDEEMSEEELAEFEAELKAQRSEIEVGSGDYPRPPCEDAGLRAAAGSGPDADGVHRRAPALADAREALKSAKTALRGELRGDPTWVGTRGVGYKPLVLDDFSRARLWGIRALLSLYTDENSLTHGHWGDSMLQAAIAMGRGKHCAREIAVLARQFIYDREILELNPYGKWTESMLMDEDLLNEIKLFLQSLGTEITAEKLRLYLCDPEVKRRHGIERDICHATACRYLHELGYRFSSPKVGQFVDGHERPDVVEYRDTIYLPAYFSYQDRVWVHNDDGNIENPPLGPRRVIFWYHDESVFYAHDRRRKTWVHKESTAKPYKKGEGYSYIVADYFSADFGWLKCPWTGRSARVSIKPGANRDGYFTNVEVREQARTAVALVKEIWPNYEHIFVYDNAPNHRKRPDDALSALNMPRAPSGSSAKFPDANLMGKRKKQAPDGTYVHDAHGKVEMEDVPMTGARLPNGEPQPLYFPEGHPRAGKFKGMKILLEERGLLEESKLRAECPKFKCKDKTAACCCRRVLFNQPDFENVRSLLEEECEEAGVRVLFLPRFHCELNPIEMVWGYAKRLYRLNPESGKMDVLEKNALDALDAVPLLFMRRFVNRSHRFADGYYNKRLSAKEVAWAAKRYHGHRTFPSSVLDEILRAGL